MASSRSRHVRLCGSRRALQAGTTARRHATCRPHCGYAPPALARPRPVRLPAAPSAACRFSRNTAAVITDPIFYLLALPAVTVLGLGKGGFAGIGMAATPLLALYVPPLQAAAIMLPLV